LAQDEAVGTLVQPQAQGPVVVGHGLGQAEHLGGESAPARQVANLKGQVGQVDPAEHRSLLLSVVVCVAPVYRRGKSVRSTKHCSRIFSTRLGSRGLATCASKPAFLLFT